MQLTAKFTNIDEFKTEFKKLSKDAKEPINKEFAYAIKQYSDAQDLVPRLSGNLQETATPMDEASVEWDGEFAYIRYPAIYSTRLWFGVDFHFTTTENRNAQAKWLEPIFNDTPWVKNALEKLFTKHVIFKGERDYGRFIK